MANNLSTLMFPRSVKRNAHGPFGPHLSDFSRHRRSPILCEGAETEIVMPLLAHFLLASVAHTANGFTADFNTHIIVDMRNTRDPLGKILCAPFIWSAGDKGRQRHFALCRTDLDIGGVEIGIVAQAIVDVFHNALVGLYITFRSLPAKLIHV